MKTCACGGEMREGLTTICASKIEPLVKVENIPAWICEVCEEELIEGRTLRVIEQIEAEGKPTRIVECKVYDFKEAKIVNSF